MPIVTFPEKLKFDPDYAPEHNPDLFRISAGQKISRKNFANLLPWRKRPDLTLVLDDLLDAARSTDGWDKWKRTENDSTRVFTPYFMTPGMDKDGQLSRLHIVLPIRIYPQPIVHLEKIAPVIGGNPHFEGQEVVWREGSSEKPIIRIGLDGRQAPVTPEQNTEYWNGAEVQLRAAHAEFC